MYRLVMAVSKKKKDKKTAEEKTTAKKKEEKKSGKPKHAVLSASQRSSLRGLEASYADPIEFPVADILQECRELEAVMRKLGAALYAGSDLQKAIGASLAGRRTVLDAAEAEWAEHRIVILPEQLRGLRKEAEELKKDSIAALRHFKRKDAAVQRKLDAIIEGSGLADLIDDLQKLAALLDAEKKALQKADLAKNAAKRARELAEMLGGDSAEHATDTDGSEALELRNRAYWWLRDAMDEVRSAGRYVYRKTPRRRALFRASSTRAKVRGNRSRGSAKPSTKGDAREEEE
jgi:hypothetical protein